MSGALTLGIALLLPPQPVSAAEEAPYSERAAQAAALVESPSLASKRRGFLQLEALRERATIPFIRRFIDDPEDPVRAYAYRSLMAVEGQGAVDDLLRAYEGEKDPRGRRAILLALEPHREQNPAIVELCYDAMTDRSTEVRMAAVDIVSRFESPEAAARIRERARKEWRRDVKRVLSLAVDRIESRN